MTAKSPLPYGTLALAAALTVVMFILRAHAEDLPVPNKVVTLVQSDGCDMARLRRKVDAVIGKLVRNPHTTRVVVDWPVDSAHNVDLQDKPSPIIAALEVTAPQPSLPGLANIIQQEVGSVCRVRTYLVHERRFLENARTWKLGEPSPDGKILTTLVRKNGLSVQEFDRIWSGPHAELALAWRSASAEKAGHYVQNIVVAAVGDRTPSVDGIGEGDPPSRDEHEREARMKTAEHSRTFMDMTKTVMFLARETVLKD